MSAVSQLLHYAETAHHHCTFVAHVYCMRPFKWLWEGLCCHEVAATMLLYTYSLTPPHYGCVGCLCPTVLA